MRRWKFLWEKQFAVAICLVLLLILTVVPSPNLAFAKAAILPGGVSRFRYNKRSPVMYVYDGHPFDNYRRVPRWHEGFDGYPYRGLLGLTSSRRFKPFHVRLVMYALGRHTTDPYEYNYRYP